MQRKARKPAVSHEVGAEAPAKLTVAAWTPTFSGTLDVSPKQALLEQLERQQKSLEAQLSELRILRKGIEAIEVDPS